MSLVFLCYPMMGGPPAWVPALAQAARPDFVVYDSGADYGQNETANEGRFFAELTAVPVSDLEKMRNTLLGFHEDLFKAFDQIPARYWSSVQIAEAVVFQDLFALVRSKVVVLDGNNPSFGETGQIALFAQLLKIPVVLVSDLITQPPWLTLRSTVSTRAENMLQTVGLVLSGKAPPAVQESMPAFQKEALGGVDAAQVIQQAKDESKGILDRLTEATKEMKLPEGSLVPVEASLSKAMLSLRTFLDPAYSTVAMIPEGNKLAVIVTKAPGAGALDLLKDLSEKGYEGIPVEVRHLWATSDPSK